MDYQESPPPPPLDGWIRAFWRLRGHGLGQQPVIPDGRMEIVIHLADCFSQIDASGNGSAQGEVMLAGQLTAPLLLAAGSSADVIGIRFRTAGARALLGIPLDAVRNQVIPLDAVDRSLSQALLAAARSSLPFESLAQAIGARATGLPSTGSARAVHLLAVGCRIAAVAETLGVSVRTLERRIAHDTGLPPKVLQRMIRFRRFYGLCQAGGITGSRAAQLAGYYDQSHAERDFRGFTGTAPIHHFHDTPGMTAALLSHSS
jgi:AraC-like DNA-binding protein